MISWLRCFLGFHETEAKVYMTSGVNDWWPWHCCKHCDHRVAFSDEEERQWAPRAGLK